MDTHRFEVRQLSKRIHSFHEAKRPFRIYHSTSHTTRIPPPTRNLVHTCALNNILDINTTNNFAMAEPNVTMEQLAKETLKHGLLPPVVAPLPGMTVGGCFAGTATSSASFKFGYFDRAVNWVEVVLPDGRITRASRSRNRDLLDGLVGSLGSLGVVTLFQVKLVPAARFVELGYLPVKSAEEVVEGVAKCVGEAENDFVEGVVFGEKARVFGVVVTGRLCAFKTGRLVRFSGAADPWFYQHVLGAGETSVQTRWLADYALRSGNLAKMAQDLHWAEHLVLQDVDVPVGSSLGLLTWLGENLEPYPIFLTPVRQWGDGSAIFRPNPTNTPLTLQTTIRSFSPSTLNSRSHFRHLNRSLEHLVQRLGGHKHLHARTFYTESEFWSSYPRRGEYEKVREKYGAEYLASVWEKCRTDERKGRGIPLVRGFWGRVFWWGSVVGMGGLEKEEEGLEGKKGKEKAGAERKGKERVESYGERQIGKERTGTESRKEKGGNVVDLEKDIEKLHIR